MIDSLRIAKSATAELALLPALANRHGCITGATGIVKNGTGVATFSNTGNAFTGGVTLNAGTLTFTGTSSYTGATAVNEGALLVDGSLGNTTVTVAGGALLGGDGDVIDAEVVDKK